ncbi:MAG TPA: hypothetical protein VII09_01415 [Opitutaceae bacterium]
MGSPRIRTGLFGAAIAAGLILLLLVYRPRLAPLGRAVPALRTRELEAEARPNPTRSAGTAGTQERSRLVDELNSPQGDIHADLRLINEVFAAYRGSVRAENPVGENGEITAVLAGRNRLGFAFIPADSPAINAKGELCDRWGSPFFFHQLSGQRMEVRSAGPDRKLWTADDQVLTP